MARRKYTPEQIISKLREVEVALAQGATCDLSQIVVPVAMLVPGANSEASTRRRDVSFQAQA